MAIRVVQLGSPRARNEGLRIGTVRRPPRGVPRSEFSSGNWYDVWFPTLAPSAETVKLGQGSATDREWARFVRAYESEMREPAARQAIDLLAALSHASDFAVGCYCVDEQRCHRSVLRRLLADAGALIA